jgi:hypothetical protein
LKLFRKRSTRIGDLDDAPAIRHERHRAADTNQKCLRL